MGNLAKLLCPLNVNSFTLLEVIQDCGKREKSACVLPKCALSLCFSNPLPVYHTCIYASSYPPTVHLNLTLLLDSHYKHPKLR